MPVYVTVAPLLGPVDYRPTRTETKRLVFHLVALFRLNDKYVADLQRFCFIKAYLGTRSGQTVLEFELQLGGGRRGAGFLTSPAAAHFLRHMRNEVRPDTLEHEHVTDFMRDAVDNYGDEYGLNEDVTVYYTVKLGSGS